MHDHDDGVLQSDCVSFDIHSVFISSLTTKLIIKPILCLFFSPKVFKAPPTPAFCRAGLEMLADMITSIQTFQTHQSGLSGDI